MRNAGEARAVSVLAGRAAADVELNDPKAPSSLLRVFWEVGERKAVSVLRDCDPAAHVELNDPKALPLLTEALRKIGARQAVTALIARTEDAGHHPEHFTPHGRDPEGRPTAPWTWNDLIHNPAPLHSRL